MMGMPITVEIVDTNASITVLREVFDYFDQIDQRFSTYKEDSEISRLNRGELTELDISEDMKTVLGLCEATRQATDGYFDIWHGGQRDPSGLVKGWAIQQAAGLLQQNGFRNYYVDAGGDIQVSGLNAQGQPWRIGVRNPFNRDEIIKTLVVTTEGVATSGAYIRGQHIYNPLDPSDQLQTIASVTVIGPDIFEADRYATAAYAMGQGASDFIEKLAGFEAYIVDNKGLATLTSGIKRYIADV
jgi:thiamine biosynthesis lipoprotein